MLVSDVLKDIQAIHVEHTVKRDFEKLEQTGRQLENLLNDAPIDQNLLFQYGTYLHFKGAHGAAIHYFNEVLRQTPENVQALCNVGVCYRLLHMTIESRTCFKRALTLNQDNITYNNLAATYINEGCPEKGMEYAEKAMLMDENDGKSKWNHSLLSLELEDWEKGFLLYDAGFISGERMMRNYGKDQVPWWEGQDGTVVLWDEQGLGDRLLFANLLNSVRDRNNTFILECHPRLESIYRRSFPWIKDIYPTVKQELIDWPKDHHIDYKFPIASLSRFTWAKGEFDTTPYILPDPELVKKYRAQYEALGSGPYIGMSWYGGVSKTHTQKRSLKLGWFKELISLGGTWVSMQYHEWAEQKVSKFREDEGLPLFHIKDEKNYDETLAAAAACDLVITACNTLAHTCGSAGIPCWVLVPKEKAWRYTSTTTFPWYGSHIEMIHQNKDWLTTLELIVPRLKDWVNARIAA